jgi:hypothetical protein
MHVWILGAVSQAVTTGGTPIWVPILTFVGGAVVTMIIEFLRTIDARQDRRQDAAERRADREAEVETRAEERVALRLEEHRERDRASLTELQDRLSDYVRKTGRAHAEDFVAWRAAGEPEKYPVGRLSADLDKTLNDDHRRVLVLMERVDSEAIRDGVLILARLCATVLAEDSSYAVSKKALDEVADTFASVNAEIGRALRHGPD